MAHLYPIPFADLARRMCREVETSGAVFDLPERKWWIPDPALDFSAIHFSRHHSRINRSRSCPPSSISP